MLINKIDSLLEEVATKTGYPQEVVADVIKHFFSYIKNYLLNPTLVGLRIPFLGIIRPDKKSLNFYLKRKIRHLRTDRTEENLSQFRKYWKLRRLLQDDAKRRNFKKRYGTARRSNEDGSVIGWGRLEG